ncbi:RICIN domain-containing protein [Streptomyces sp. NBC_01565]|uniref:RICIN domain-containing protein n=1 Tax=unclassified Streptomyces TaxID=2593676 RepID=UPI002257284D|nr:RICIN domain-containing protein [Streptomyces sp. NBC_01565]MCX4546254.1 RICIN domain-containing protein [Streptomyces sp. NBC_01565]
MKPNPLLRARHGLLVLAATLGLVFGVTAAPAQAASRTYDFTFTISPQHAPGMCLEVADWSTANGAAVRQWPCTGGANQKWRKYFMSDSSATGPYWYVNEHSGKCLEIGGWAKNNGATANQWDCHYGTNQSWYGSDLIYQVYADYSSKCLEIADWSQSAGARARLWSCHYGANQNYNFRIV